MHTQTSWQVVPDFQPWNPTQKALTSYCGLPGGYCNTYYDHVPNVTNLMGPQGMELLGQNVELLGHGTATMELLGHPSGMELLGQPAGMELLGQPGGMTLLDPSGTEISQTRKILWLSAALAIGAAAGFAIGRVAGRR